MFLFFQVVPLFTFFVPTALGDCNELVRNEMLNAALAAVNQLGKVKLTCVGKVGRHSNIFR